MIVIGVVNPSVHDFLYLHALLTSVYRREMRHDWPELNNKNNIDIPIQVWCPGCVEDQFGGTTVPKFSSENTVLTHFSWAYDVHRGHTKCNDVKESWSERMSLRYLFRLQTEQTDLSSLSASFVHSYDHVQDESL